MHHRIYRFSTREPLDVVPMHVLALAYGRVWQLLYGTRARGQHVIDRLDLLIEFHPDVP